MAERTEVVAIPEQREITSMRTDVVHVRRGFDALLAFALDTERLLLQHA
jgi:hypothetical protein